MSHKKQRTKHFPLNKIKSSISLIANEREDIISRDINAARKKSCQNILVYVIQNFFSVIFSYFHTSNF